MTQLPNVFDPTQHNPATGGAGQLPVSPPTGLTVAIVDSSYVQTANKTGNMLVLTLEVQDGPDKGATGDYRLNVENESADAVRIALSQLSAICHCVGHLQPLQDISVLYGKPFKAIVKQQDSKEGREKGYTEVKAVRDMQGNKPGEQGSGAGATSAPAPTPAPAQPMAQPVAQAAPVAPPVAQAAPAVQNVAPPAPAQEAAPQAAQPVAQAAPAAQPAAAQPADPNAAPWAGASPQ